MAAVNFTVTYSQTDNDAQNGDITFNSQTLEASGRLDAIGSSVFAVGFTIPGVPNCDVLTGTIECTRTSVSTMQVKMTFSGNCVGYSGSSYNEQIMVEHVVDDVPVNIN